MTNALVRIVDGQPERFCRKCQEWWPDTSEFFNLNKAGDSRRSPCKACIVEKRYQTGATKPCCVPGCTNPRYHWRFARCYEHRTYAMNKKSASDKASAQKPKAAKSSKRRKKTITIDYKHGVWKGEQVKRLDTFKQLDMVIEAYRTAGYKVVEKR